MQDILQHHSVTVTLSSISLPGWKTCLSSARALVSSIKTLQHTWSSCGSRGFPNALLREATGLFLDSHTENKESEPKPAVAGMEKQQRDSACQALPILPSKAPEHSHESSHNAGQSLSPEEAVPAAVSSAAGLKGAGSPW